VTRLAVRQTAATDSWPVSPDAGHETSRYRRLAISVITQALHDLSSEAGCSKDRLSARAFLTGSRMLRHWCAMADLDAARLSAYARDVIAGSGRTPGGPHS
jgi:hypothetical protein